MKTYVNKIIPSYFVEYEDEIDAEYWEGQIGETFADFENGKWVLLSDEQVAFKAEHPNANVAEVLATEVQERTEEELVEAAKQAKITQIENYDKSRSVNNFSINGVNMWLNFDERSRLIASLSAYETAGAEYMSKWFNGIEFTFSLSQWKQMLAALEIYASEALNVTEAKKAAVNSLTTVEDIKNYDITAGYPDKLIF